MLFLAPGVPKALAVSKVLIAPIISNLRNLRTEGDTTKSKIKMTNLKEILRFYSLLFWRISVRFKVTVV